MFLPNVGHDSSHMCGAVWCSVLQCVAVCCSVCYRLYSPSLHCPQTGLHLHNPHTNGVLSSLHFMSVKPFSEHQYLLHTCGRRVILSRMVVAACGSIGEIAIAQGLLRFYLGCACTENTAPRRCPCLVSASSGGQLAYLVPAVAWTPTWLPCCRELELVLPTPLVCTIACVAQLVRARDC